MANISFLDLMFAEALASGLAREAIRQEKPPPDNFFLLPSDPQAWTKIQEASRKENMVVCAEFTDNRNDNCKAVQRLFMDLAREFEGIPFLRAVIGPSTHDRMRSDLGGVQFTPTILVVFYGDGSVSRAKFEGVAEIRETGKLRGVIKELIDRRVKLKMAERLATGLAEHLKSEISDRERRMREEYESKLERQMAEKEETFKKKDEEKRKKEEQEEQEKDQKLRLANERLRQERPQRLEELRRMDLDHAPIRELKSIMEKMGISSVGCLSRKDLKEKLLENVPELRLTATSGASPTASSGKSFDPLGSMPIDNESESLRKTLNKTEADLKQMTARANGAEDSVSDLKRRLAALQKQLTSLKADNSSLQNKVASANKRPVTNGSAASGDDSAKVKKLEENLLQTRMLYTTTLQDFEIQNIISECDQDNSSLVLRAKCIKSGLPNQNTVYAMKFLSDYVHATTQTEVSRKYRNEYQLLCELPPHPNIIHMWAFFYDRPGYEVVKYFKKTSGSQRALGLFILMDEHPTNMSEQLATLVGNRGPLSSKVCSWLKDLLSGLVFLEKHCVVHRDLKLGNLLQTGSGRVIICDFGKAVQMDDNFTMEYKNFGADIGGNHAHLAPEILNCRAGPRSRLDYSKQPVWAAGVLAYELAGHQSPFQAGVIDQRGYGVDQLPPLKATYCANSSHCQTLPAGLTDLVQSMLQPEPGDRPTLQHCLDVLNNLS